ncbi:MAG: hypothetical protein AAF919_07075 [Pseudomonadota bacterium]
MTRAIRHNLHLALLVGAILVGATLQKHGHHGGHVDCNLCVEKIEAS